MGIFKIFKFFGNLGYLFTNLKRFVILIFQQKNFNKYFIVLTVIFSNLKRSFNKRLIYLLLPNCVLVIEDFHQRFKNFILQSNFLLDNFIIFLFLKSYFFEKNLEKISDSHIGFLVALQTNEKNKFFSCFTLFRIIVISIAIKSNQGEIY